MQKKMESSTLRHPYRAGFEFEKKYHGCAQCAVSALYTVFPEHTNPDVFRAASGLGGGVGLSCKGHCGALSGAVMVLSQLFGRELNAIEDLEKKRTYAFRLANEMVDHFIVEFGTVFCGEIQDKLLGRRFDLWDPDDKQSFEDAGAHDPHCPSVVGKAVQWASELIKRESKQTADD
jgi:C_GCAxxG_C_C family probable redox protein